ncbi:MAG: ParA family protein [Pirellulaceae bacterium]
MQTCLEKTDLCRSTTVILDCPPSLGVLSVACLTPAEYARVVVQPGGFKARTLIHLHETVRMRNERVNPRLSVIGAVLTNFHPRRGPGDGAANGHSEPRTSGGGNAAGESTRWSASRFAVLFQRRQFVCDKPREAGGDTNENSSGSPFHCGFFNLARGHVLHEETQVRSVLVKGHAGERLVIDTRDDLEDDFERLR